MSLINFVKNNSVLNKSHELIFFGGSFNPWHEGHSSCLKLAPANRPIIVIPDHNPFKDLTVQSTKHSSITDIQHELAKIETTTYLFDEFLQNNKKNPSHKWIIKIKKEFPQKKISLLMGFDTFISIDRWIKADKILNALDALYIASRLDDEKIKAKQIENLHTINPKLKILFIGRHDYEELSSTKIRNQSSSK
ncbi:MAG: hypothetical protein QF441_10885 [Bacteriovoracaceae bacterium]|jgi:nicotinate-nucleotide adenylyltransferase|nr:hypothetical protein [Halobacteriovoraceae bacterium]MDP7321106.1 hypothetical protein [Bacteriovoracaceae bacterium]